MIDQIFAFESTRTRQRAAPLFQEREEFLSSMFQQGTSRVRLRSLASMLLHIVRTLELKDLRNVEAGEIQMGALRWVADQEHNNRNGQAKSASLYIYLATKWLRFHGKLTGPGAVVVLDDGYIQRFVSHLADERGLASASVDSCRRRITAFFRWKASNHLALDVLTVKDVDRYLLEKRNAGYKPRSLASLCRALKMFFHFAEQQHWNHAKIAVAIQSPRVPRHDSEPKGPSWQDVRRLLDYDFGCKPSDLRAAAVISLCSIYGLRNSEVIRLKLSDLDWANEILTIKRAKTGRVQQFPIQIEVGEKILAYLRYGRPKCSHRNLFVSLRPPFRVIHPAGLWVVVAERMNTLGISSKTVGTHALRHSCATQLLREGSSLPEIAQFLGHSNLKSVSIYAKHDVEALKQIASVSLADLL